MKAIILTFTLISFNSFALSSDWKSISCSISANRYLDKEFANPFSFPDRINLYRDNSNVEIRMKSHEGKTLFKDNGKIEESSNGKIHIYTSTKFEAHLGHLNLVQTEVKIFKKNSKQTLVAHLICNSN